MRHDEVVRPMRGDRRGVALLEAIIALAILAGAVLSAGAYVVRLTRGVSDERVRAQALQLVAECFEQVKTAPSYGKIDTLYLGIENNISGYTGFVRQTDITRIGGTPVDSVDYKIVTVTVNTLTVPRSVSVKKSIVIADF